MSFSLFGFHSWRCCQRSALAARIRHGFAPQTQRRRHYTPDAAAYNYELPPHLQHQDQPEASTSTLEHQQPTEAIKLIKRPTKKPRYDTESARQTRKYDVSVSKRMRFLLAEGGKQHGLRTQPDGYVPVRELSIKLKHPTMSGVTYETIERIVNEDNRERYTLAWKPSANLDCLYPRERDAYTWWVRVNTKNQPGHIPRDLERIYRATDIPQAVYTTNLSSWKRIGKEGIPRPSRSRFIPLHKHSSSLPVHPSPQILIFIDVARALASGLSFFLEPHKDRLYTEGNRLGILEPRFFKKVVQREVLEHVIYEEKEERTLSSL